MGEYAYQEILDKHGIDLFDDEYIVKRKEKVFSCSCGKLFYSYKARADHQFSTAHKPSKKQEKENENRN